MWLISLSKNIEHKETKIQQILLSIKLSNGLTAHLILSRYWSPSTWRRHCHHRSLDMSSKSKLIVVYDGDSTLQLKTLIHIFFTVIQNTLSLLYLSIKILFEPFLIT